MFEGPQLKSNIYLKKTENEYIGLTNDYKNVFVFGKDI